MVRDAVISIIFSLMGLGAAHATERRCNSIASADLSAERLIRDVTDPKSGIKTVEDLLCRLPPDFRKNYLLGFESKSVQGSSYKNPRVVMFDSNHPPRLVLSFNGDRSQAGYQKIEILAPVKANAKGEVIDLIDVDLSKPSHDRVQKNPQQCLSCHSSSDGTAARPLFNAVPVWPGYYGTSVLTGFFDSAVVKKQAEEFKQFQQSAPRNSRYKYLVGLQQLISRTNAEEFQKTPGLINSQAPAFLHPNDEILPERNRQFTMDMAAINRPRLLKLIRRTPFYEKYKFAIFSTLTICSDQKVRLASTYLPADLRIQHVNTSRLDATLQETMSESKWDEFAAKLAIAAKTGAARRMDNAKNVFGDNIEGRFLADTALRQAFYGANSGLTAQLRYLFESRVNPVDMKAWNIDPQQGDYRFNNNHAIDFDFMALAPELASSDPELKAFVKSTRQESIDPELLVDCDALQKRSLKSLSGLAEQASKERAANVTEGTATCLDCSPLNRANTVSLDAITAVADYGAKSLLTLNCATCHTAGVKNAPSIDFNDLKCSPHTRAHIVERIGLDADDSAHMPYLGHLGADEISTIKSYLKRLSENQSSAGCGIEIDWQ